MNFLYKTTTVVLFAIALVISAVIIVDTARASLAEAAGLAVVFWVGAPALLVRLTHLERQVTT